MRYPIYPNDMYWVRALNLSLMLSLRTHSTKLRQWVMGSVLSFLPFMIFQAVRMNRVME
jgi:hypothetical protein